jgi:hypothetical protein
VAGVTGYGIKQWVKDGRHHGTRSQNHSKRASEAFEGRANAELVEHPVGDHDLYE